MNEIIEVSEGEVVIEDSICPIVPLDINCKEFTYTIDPGGERHLKAKCGDGSTIDYPDISPLYPSYENITKDEEGNIIHITFVQRKEDVKESQKTLFNLLGMETFSVF